MRLPAFAFAFALVVAGAVLRLAACARAPEALDAPAAAGLYDSLPVLEERVEEVEGPPDWARHPREEEGLFYAVGSARAQKDAGISLYLATRDAQTTLLDALRRRGARVEAPRGLVPPLDVDESAIALERLAHDASGRRWYALARFDLAAAAARDRLRVEELDRGLEEVLPILQDLGAAPDARLRAALATLYALDHRFQHAAQYRVFAGDALELGTPSAVLEDAARRVLAARAVRLDVDAPPIDGLVEAVRAPLEAFGLRTDDFAADAWVSLRAAESSPWTRDDPHVALTGELVVAIEGGDARPRSLPLRAIGRGVRADEARRRAERALVEEVRASFQRVLHGYDLL
jgi:hypothetical protein